MCLPMNRKDHENQTDVDATTVTDLEKQNGDDVAMATAPERQNVIQEGKNNTDFNHRASEEVLEEEITQ
ncbi:hypothetical protein L195_g063241, partial [Trifolium pratense]